MDKSARAGLLLIGLILLVYFFITNPSKKDVEKYNARKDSLEAVTKQHDSLKTVPPAVIAAHDASLQHLEDSIKAVKLGSFSKLAEGESKLCVLENELVKVIISSKGGSVKSVQLKNYRRADGTELYLLESGNNSFNISFPTRQAQTINTADLYFNVTENSASKIVLTAPVDSVTRIEEVYSLENGSYTVDYHLNMVGMNSVVNSQSLQIDWSARIPKQEKARTQEIQTTTVWYKEPDKNADNISESKEETKDITYKLQWLSFKQHFFNSTFISTQGFTNSKITTENVQEDNYVKKLSATAYVDFRPSEANNSYEFKFYFGPNDYDILKKQDIGMEKLVYLGWGIFGWVNRFITIPIFNLLSKFISNYGIIILLLTVIIKLGLFPMVYGSYKSMAKMRLLKPDIDIVNAKFKDDAQRKQQETMKLYRRAGVNPLGGCLPLLLQLPFLMSMFQFFPSCIDLRQKSFLWCPDLSTYDSVLNLGFNIPFYGDHVSLWTLLMTVVTLIMTYWNNQMSNQPAEYKWIGYIMPVVFLGVFNNNAAGFTYYSTIATAMTLGQQLIARRLVDDKKLHAMMEENKKRPESQTKSGFQRRLDEAMKQQQQKKKK